MVTPTALTERRGSHLVWEAWTDFGSVGAYPRAILGRSDKFSEGLVHLRLDPPDKSWLSERRQVAGQQTAKTVFSHFRHSITIVAGARAVQMSRGATPEAQGARRSARTEARARGLFASRKPRRGKRVNPSTCQKSRYSWPQVPIFCLPNILETLRTQSPTYKLGIQRKILYGYKLF